MVVASGTRFHESSFAGGSWSPRGGFGAFGGVSAGTSRSALAAGLDPGERPSYWPPVVLGVALFFLGGSFDAGRQLHQAITLLVLILTFLLLSRQATRRRTWEYAQTQLSQSWVCRKCGWSWVP